MSNSSDDKGALREALPDVPRWLEARDLLARADSILLQADSDLASNSGTHSRSNLIGIILSPSQDLGFILGVPSPDLLRDAASRVTELLTTLECSAALRPHLPHHGVEVATLLVRPNRLSVRVPRRAPDQHYTCAPHSSISTRLLTLDDLKPTTASSALTADLSPEDFSSAPALGCDAEPLSFKPPGGHLNSIDLPFSLWQELTSVLTRGEPVTTALNDGVPVAFAYAAARTESLFAFSIDTLTSFRRRGFATAAALAHESLLAQIGLAGVWGAAASNPASMALALRLGYEANDHLALFSRRSESVANAR